jgi:hypothetical protein
LGLEELKLAVKARFNVVGDRRGIYLTEGKMPKDRTNAMLGNGQYNNFYTIKERRKLVKEILRKPHHLTGVEIRLKNGDVLLKGVTRVEFEDEAIVFHTVLGQVIRFGAEIENAKMDHKGFIFELGLEPFLIYKGKSTDAQDFNKSGSLLNFNI